MGLWLRISIYFVLEVILQKLFFVFVRSSVSCRDFFARHSTIFFISKICRNIVRYLTEYLYRREKCHEITRVDTLYTRLFSLVHVYNLISPRRCRDWKRLRICLLWIIDFEKACAATHTYIVSIYRVEPDLVSAIMSFDCVRAGIYIVRLGRKSRR